MTRPPTCGMVIIFMGALFVGYWTVAYNQWQQATRTPMGALAVQEFFQRHANLYLACHLLNYDPLGDYSQVAAPPGQFISKRMLSHAYFGIAMLCLGISFVTFRSVTLLRRITHYVAVAGFGAALTVAAMTSPWAMFYLRCASE